MGLFDDTPQTPADTREAVRVMQAFGERVSDPELIDICEQLEHLAVQLCEALEVEPDMMAKSILVGCALQRQEIAQASAEAD